MDFRDARAELVGDCLGVVTEPMVLWALLASGQITIRKVDGSQTLDKPIKPVILDLAA